LLDSCPLCGSRLEKGFLIPSRALSWDTKKHRWSAEGEQLVPFSFTVQNFEAYRCRKCKLILFKYDQESTSQDSENIKST